ncbi:hypothetical protein [Treponema phagedenis]|uniref:hypothetical protein n=1 Tax=Treponema phagedenis TaxID=162 RepID=UPI0015A37182|nr:hypothetical protein [Treponema phagedenis]NVP25521.1 hypothetical protein [Treponema phagedenis]QLC60019.1 hypothetical protein HW453_15415 [Treponema phagedenis]
MFLKKRENGIYSGEKNTVVPRFGMVTYYKIINENEIQLLGIENVDELNSPLAEFYILKRETK